MFDMMGYECSFLFDVVEYFYLAKSKACQPMTNSFSKEKKANKHKTAFIVSMHGGRQKFPIIKFKHT